MADRATEFLSGVHGLEHEILVGLQQGEATTWKHENVLDADGAEPSGLANLGEGLCPAMDVFQLV